MSPLKGVTCAGKQSIVKISGPQHLPSLSMPTPAVGNFSPFVYLSVGIQ